MIRSGVNGPVGNVQGARNQIGLLDPPHMYLQTHLDYKNKAHILVGTRVGRITCLLWKVGIGYCIGIVPSGAK
jgi:hypothetical protein